MFFAPLEPFLVDDVPDRAHRGRIVRAALDPYGNGCAAT